MKNLLVLTLTMVFAGCMTTPPNSQWARRTPPAINELDSLEMLLQHEQNLESRSRTLASSENNLQLGMLKNNVQSFLGRPDQVEVAGNPIHGNERWTYIRSVPTLDGYYTEKRVIYFERGNVVGWETH